MLLAIAINSSRIAGSAGNAGFPPMPGWFADNRDFGTIRAGLVAAGLDEKEVDGIMGENWLRFFDESFEAQSC